MATTTQRKAAPSFWGEVTRLELYKRNQGRLTRQLTALGFALIILFGAWTLSQGPLAGYENPWIRVGIPTLVAGLGAWLVFRAINYPRFADFLISVEAEMDKVSWPGRRELFRSTAVVIGVMFLLGFVLFAYDIVWQWFFKLIGFLQLEPTDIQR
jgi:preprotein translocase subunit SecE